MVEDLAERSVLEDDEGRVCLRFRGGAVEMVVVDSWEVGCGP